MRSSRAFSRSCSMDTGAVLCVAALIAGPFLNRRSVGRAWRPLIVLNRACRCHADGPRRSDARNSCFGSAPSIYSRSTVDVKRYLMAYANEFLDLLDEVVMRRTKALRLFLIS